jgi:sialate O-acetylesterase
MVVQQGREIPVWGWAGAGDSITVSMAGEVQHATSGPDGRWKVLLPPLKAGGPFQLTIQGKQTIVIKDVMVGEVWVLSGQSNMTFPVSRSENAAKEIPSTECPQIRLFTVPQKDSLEAQTTVAARWEICGPETVKDFSAVGYFFGRELQRRLGVPVGLIHSSWPGTGAEDWTPLASLQKEPALASILDTWHNASAESKTLAVKPSEFQLEFDDFELLKGPEPGAAVPFSNFDNGMSEDTLHGSWSYTWKTAPNTTFELVQPGRGNTGYAARVSGHTEAQDDARLQATFTPDGSAADLSSYQGIRFYCRGEGYFRFRSLQPTITDWDDYGTQAIAATPDWKPVTIWFRDLRQDGWGIPVDFTPQSLSAFVLEIVQSPSLLDRPPAGMFNGMIAPLLPYGIRGAAWYQGEGNALQAFQYRSLLPALIQGWRQAWGQGDFPFLIVQLPNYGNRRPEPSDSAWSELREAQLMTLRVPNTGLAVTIDLGEAVNLHPLRKREVGERLALWALGTTYGRPIVYSGPLYQSMKVQGNRIRIQFSHVGPGLETRGGSELRGFAIAGSDRVFHWASARIDGDQVIVSSPDVPAPTAVRYAWGDNPDCNLYNKDGLPASPFRSDAWTEITEKGK